MSSKKPVLETDLAALVAAGWSREGTKIGKTYRFADFGQAMSFMARCIPEIEKLNHHPEWSNIYNKVTVHLTTHDAGDVTGKDGELARIMDRIAANFLPKIRDPKDE